MNKNKNNLTEIKKKSGKIPREKDKEIIERKENKKKGCDEKREI